MLTECRLPTTLPSLTMDTLPSTSTNPLPSAGGPISIRNFPGNIAASYHVSAELVPSSLYVVLFCVNVTVWYQDDLYRSCIARKSASPVWMSCACTTAPASKLQVIRIRLIGFL